MKKTLLLCLLLAAGVPCLADDKDKPPIPPGPIITPLPEQARWTVVIAPPKPKAGQSGEGGAPTPAGRTGAAGSADKKPPRTILITKSGKNYLEVATEPDGSKSVRWTINGTETVYLSGKPVLFGSGPRKDFEELGWISRSNYISLIKVGGEDCYCFQDKIRQGNSTESLKPVTATAGISVATRLPVYFAFGDEVRSYEFGPQPTEPLTVPPEVLSIIEARAKSVNQLLKRPN